MSLKTKFDFNLFADRLKYAIEHKGLPVLTIAQLSGIKHQTIQYLCKKNAQKSKFTPQLAKILGVNSDWLANGIGSIFITPKQRDASTYQIDTFASEKLQDALQNKKDLSKLVGTKISYCGVKNHPSANMIAVKILAKKILTDFAGSAIIYLDTNNHPKSDDLVYYFSNEKNDFLIALYSKISSSHKKNIIGIIDRVLWDNDT